MLGGVSLVTGVQVAISNTLPNTHTHTTHSQECFQFPGNCTLWYVSRAMLL